MNHPVNPEVKDSEQNGETAAGAEGTKLARRLGLFDATMIVMGGIVGSGIFINPYVVAQQVHTPFLILGAWLLGGMIALAGAFVYAELADRCPDIAGQYAYLRRAFHPSVAFIYGWALLLVTQTGGMAAVAVTFSRYFLEITRAPMPDWVVAALTLAFLTVINCLGVRAGSSVQNFLMVLKILAIAALIICGFFFVAEPKGLEGSLLDRPLSLNLFTAMGAALIPVMFAYGGWQTASFVAGEMREPRRDLARGLLLGVIGVILLYTLVNIVCLYVLGAERLAATATPASAVMRAAFGERGAALIAVGIAISTLGFLSQGMLTAPRVYFAMAKDRLFFSSVGRLSPRTQVPVLAIALQGALAIVIALSGKYEQILNYVVSIDFIWFGLTAASLFIFRRREARFENGEINGRESNIQSETSLANESFDKPEATSYRVPGHPLTTAFFIAANAQTPAADLRRTAYGDFDINPKSGQTIIPRNYGTGSSFFVTNLRISKTFGFGDLPEAQTGGAGQGGGERGGRGGGGGRRGGGGAYGEAQTNKRFSLNFSISIQNLFNTTNESVPVGNLSSPLFGVSTSSAGGFGRGGGNQTAGNRRIELQARLSF